MTRFIQAFALCLIGVVQAFMAPGEGRADVVMEWGGHLRGQGTVSRPANDTLDQRGDAGTFVDGAAEFRLKHRWFFGERLDLTIHYEAVAFGGDSLQNVLRGGESPGTADGFFFPGGVSDDRRLFRLTRTVDESDHLVCYHRLDRLALTWLPDWGSLRLGRQALTWGNGLIFNPMDLFNPFSPAAVQRDYKVGDDMLLVQFPGRGGGDVQLLYVPRRAPDTGHVARDQSSFVGKLHFMTGDVEMDLMAGEHFSNPVAGLGVSGYFREAAWRLDTLVQGLHDADDDKWGFVAVTANMDYSWVWKGKNMYGLVEFYFNSLGKTDYARAVTSMAIVRRLERGELFTLGRVYLAGKIQVELHPLFNFFFTVISNVQDPSFICRPHAVWDAAENIQLMLGADLYAGGSGSEFGGFDLPGTLLQQKSAHRFFTWLTWYF